MAGMPPKWRLGALLSRTSVALAFLLLVSTAQAVVSIRIQPRSQNVALGSKVTLSVSASGSPLTFQWLKDGSAIPGATSSSFSMASAGLGDAGSYTVLVGGVSSAAAVVKLLPFVTAQPLGTDIPAGGAATLLVQATGSPPLSYHWYLGRYALAGQTNASLVMNNISIAQAGAYVVQIINPAGLVNSAAAVINVGPAITVQPPPVVNVGAGRRAVLGFRVAGSSPLSYLWSQGGVPLPAQTNAALIIPAASMGDAGTYTVTVANRAGGVTSAASVVSVGPWFTAQPVGTNVPAGGAFAMSVGAVGTAPLSYQWYCNRRLLADQTNATLALPGAAFANAGAYYAQVRNAVAAANSAAAQGNIGPVITAQPSAIVNVGAGKRAVLGFRVAGSSPLSYLWSKDGVPLPAQIYASLTIPAASVEDGATYRVAVANMAGNVTSAASVVNVGPLFTVQPAGTNVPAGGEFSLSVSAVGTAPLFYQWYGNRHPLADQTNATLVLARAVSTNAGVYYAQVRNAAAAVNSASVQVLVGPAITVPLPAVLNLAARAQFLLSPVVTGSAPLSYQWCKDGATLAGANNARLPLGPVCAANQGLYVLTVANVAGCVTSSPVQVNIGPAISAQPQGGMVAYGAPISLSVTATGTALIYYQWYWNGAVLAGKFGKAVNNIVVAGYIAGGVFT